MTLSSAHLASILAFALWGLFPIYWKAFSEVAAWDLFAHRLLWSFVSLMAILFFKKRLNLLLEIWRKPKIRMMLIVSALMISSNWLLYIYAINTNQILQASMGYFLNPLINVFMGWLILKEKMRKTQVPAVLLALTAIVLIGVQSDIAHFPWIALTLSLTFALYGLIRKVTHVGSLEGLAFETLVMIIPTLVVWHYLPSSPLSIVDQLPGWELFLLSLSGLITCAPLILFAYGAKRLTLSSLGFIQYLSPSLKFLCGWLIFDETLSSTRLQAFSLIWVALAWYSIESFIYLKNVRKNPLIITE